MKNILTIAGSDSSGGAGIQADLKTFAALGTYGMSVITAVTAQNTCGVSKVQNIDPEIVKAQIDAIFDDIRVDAIKIGMVSDIEIIKVIVERLRFYEPPIVVLDPVMISKSGYYLLAEDACDILIKELLPLATLVTPNLPEATAITGQNIYNKIDMVIAARKIAQLGVKNVLVKGGHLDNRADDLLYKDELEIWFEENHIETQNTHGTGCTLSSALAVFLAQGETMENAVRASKQYVTTGIRHGLPIGKGQGPLHHFVSLYAKAGYTVK
ncbi:MAG TPA: bifunctional hydroxymethylpyrimidine kinase/phosphomethylpyrimidine kinase [Candidatus Avacidaminococcus intestinavium]|uniref:Hydroxymethylpyrimidine/phosphomethylpyrimidine kinase n=1 Tax=Candidatus Avacidaminococcus intestinavium TaxID=2840684 RepID=A0A9D1SLC7_9FIRM|nr:bifunctional hydroxymethylpyrimidine kinase/phosphomethylpyrimidine kinase [Candidatus Avacidaminococcus intestinavium]